jgi:ABC-type multidrug transport system ATPase subunit
VSPFLTVDGVGVRYFRGARSIDVLHDVSLTLELGEFAGLIADRSAGKTTLARVVSGALRPDRGRVVLDGETINDAAWPESSRPVYGAVGLATRRGPTLPELPVRAWIASSLMGSRSWAVANRQAQEALDRVGATGVGRETWANLADGERTLVAVAYALARRPRLLVVDDLGSGLGMLRRTRVISLLREIATAGPAVLVTSAEVSDFGGADRIWSLSDGALREQFLRPDADVVPLRPSSGGNASAR